MREKAKKKERKQRKMETVRERERGSDEAEFDTKTAK
jgi:hypothetical protein